MLPQDLTVLIEALRRQAEEAHTNAALHSTDTDYWKGAQDGIQFGIHQVEEVAQANLSSHSLEEQQRMIEQALLGLAKELRDYGDSAEKLSFDVPNTRYYIGLRDGYLVTAKVLTAATLNKEN